MHLVIISPDIAQDIIRHRWKGNYRDLKPRRVDEIQNLIETGRLDQNGETIKFDTRGNLRDGQHRIWAIFRSGKSVEMWVYRGKLNDLTVDTHEPRRLADFLKHRKEPYRALLGAALRIVQAHEQGILATGRAGKLSTQADTELLERHPRLREAVVKVANLQAGTRKIFLCSVLAFVYYMASKERPRKADEWLRDLDQGVGLALGDPALVVRQWMTNQRRVTARGAMRSQVQHLAITTKSWFAYRDGIRVPNLYWRGTGKNSEDLPVFSGYGSRPLPDAEKWSVEDYADLLNGKVAAAS